MNPTRIHHLRASYREKLRKRLSARSVPTPSGCIEWAGAKDRYGYGKIKVIDDFGAQRQTGAHRAAWIAFVGPIEGALVIDHKCRNEACINVDHLRLVTNAENTKIGDHSNKRGRSGRRDGAPVGCGKHGREDGRWFEYKKGYARWVCRICARASLKRHRERKAALHSGRKQEV